MAKNELGTKRVDPETGRKFYDLNKDPIVSPYTGKTYPRSYFEEGKIAALEEEEEVAEKEVDAEEEEGVEVVSLEEADEDVKAGDDLPDLGDDEDDVDLGDDEDDTFLADEEEEDDDVADMNRPSGMATATAAAKAMPARCRLMAMSPSRLPPASPFQSAAMIMSIGGSTAALTHPTLLATCQSARKATSTP